MRKKIYVGVVNGNREKFTSLTIPTKDTYPWYNAVIGPFKTARAAKWCAEHPHALITTIKEFERVALVLENQSELAGHYKKHLDLTN